MQFERLAYEQADALARLAYLLCGDRQLAEDLVQETLLRVHRRWSRVAAGEHPEAYVHRMLVNEHLSWRRRRSSTERPTERVAERSATDRTDGMRSCSPTFGR